MTPALRAALLRWCWTVLGVLSLAGMIWFLGPLLPFLEGPMPRLVLVLVLVAVATGTTILLDRRRRRLESALTAGITGAEAEQAREADAIKTKMATALALLKRARGNRGFLYEQPWYVLIGPPGAGKTTALLNAGLDFPLAAELGRGAVAGVGGTRLCEWWFTDDAVLIDTAGRYTTQDSDAAIDRAGWEAFLDLLRRTRPLQPLNGVIVAIGLDDIAQGTPDLRTLHASAIRRRIGDLQARFGMRMPVYALFTKCDLIAGFMEFFDDLDRERRGQVWGITFPLPAGDAAPAKAFAEEFRLLVERVEARLFERVQAERNQDRRALIAGFPAQIASLEAPLANFLDAAFGGTQADPALLLRGVYLTSATQEGTPIDRLTGMLARAFGLAQRRAARLRPEAGRSYFLTRLLRDVVFNEAMLVSERPGRQRRRVLRVAAFSGALVLAGVAAGALLQSRAASRQAIDASLAALAAYDQTAHGLPLDPVADADLSGLVSLLDRARDIGAGADCAADKLGRWLGLCQDGKLAAGARMLYRHALAHALFPRLIWRLEAQMRGNLNQPDFLYEATRIYLMLGGTGPLDRDLVREWMTLDWQAAYPGDAFASLRETMARHLDALLAEPLPPIPLDGELVAQARATFGQVTLAQRVYSRIRPSAAAQGLPPWRPGEALGAAGVGLFVRASGRPLSDGIAGFYTVDGFHKVLLPALGRAVQQVASEGWVLGRRIELDPNGEQMRALQRDVIALYENDYVQAWDQMLADLDLAPFRSLAQAAQGLYILAHAESPLRRLLASMSRQLSLSVPPSPQPGEPGGSPTPSVAQPPVSDTQLRLQALLGVRPQGDPLPARPGREIDDHYQALRDLVGAGTPLDQALKTLGDLQQQLAKLAAAPVRSGPVAVPAADDPAMAVRADARRLPQPLARWLTTIAGSGIALRSGDATQQIVAVFNGSNGPAALCAAAVNGRYPFTPGAANETSLDDFARVFAPGGVIDGFFNTLLKPYVDTSGRVWKLQSVDNVAVSVPAADLAEFQRAALIRDLFFPGGRATVRVRFDIAPISLDARATQVTLDLNGSVLAYSHGPPRPAEITWPGPSLVQTAKLAFDPPPAGGSGAWQETGPWSMFRLFSRGKLQQSGAADKYNLTFQMGERQVVFEVRAGSSPNALVPNPLQGFRCPAVQ